ncbi:MAG: hypothetical protein J1F01_03750 [Oscillospiraceae bacterium]|nr:hypothetical protein [Oscillospiraceae bacterium]
MNGEVLYERIQTEEHPLIFLDYYIITENISADYCDLKCYGIKIQKTAIYEGGGKIVESKQINNVFYRYDDVLEFIKRIILRRTEPVRLREVVENYIVESIDKAKESA